MVRSHISSSACAFWVLGLVWAVSPIHAWARLGDRQVGPVNLGSMPPQCVVAFREIGRFPVRSLETIQQLKVGTYNLSDFFGVNDLQTINRRLRQMGRSADVRMKPPAELATIVRTLKEADLDIITVQEVGSKATLETLAHALGGKYSALLVEGNDPSSRTIGFLVKKDIPFNLQLVSNRSMAADGKRVFSRDLPILLMRPAGASPDTPPLMVMMGTHNSSAYRQEFGTNQAAQNRGLQAQAIAEVTRELESRFGKDTPIVLAGDFNASPARAGEFAPLELRGGLRDVFDLGKVKREGADRWTAFVSGGGNGRGVQGRQSDGILVNESTHGLVRSSDVVRPKDAQGRPLLVPTNRNELVARFGTDHLLTVAELDFQTMYRRWLARQLGR